MRKFDVVQWLELVKRHCIVWGSDQGVFVNREATQNAEAPQKGRGCLRRRMADDFRKQY
jgi:hypothetical protein